MKAGIGFLGGAATGGAAAGFTAAVTGLGSAALESAAITAGQYIGVGAATGATGGVAASVASDAGRKFVDGEQITWKQAVGHAVVGGVIGAATGMAGGAVTKAIVAGQASAASANLEGEIAEQVAIVTGARRVGNVLAKTIPRMLTENGTEVVMGTVSRFAEERLDDSVENRSPGEHMRDGIKNLATNTVTGSVRDCTAAGVSHGLNEARVHQKSKMELKNPPSTEAINKTDEVTSRERRGRIRLKMDKENNEHLHKLKYGICSAKYQPIVNENTSQLTREFKKKLDLLKEKKEESNCHRTGKWPSGYQPLHNKETSSQSLPIDLSDYGEEEANGKVKYISEGAWFSKMVVSYVLKKNEKIVKEVLGSGSSVDIPSVARDIEVKFQVQRPFWGDICKYDRFGGFWCKPYQPHVFCYDSPPIHRTFTISGGLWYEAVMRVSNEYHEETKEM